MAGQRRRESSGHGDGRAARRRGLALAALAGAGLALAACPSSRGPFGPWIGNAGGGGGSGAGGGAPASVVGSWRNLFATTTSVTDTRWTFGSDGGCTRMVIKTMLDSGIEETTNRSCRYAVLGGSMSVTFTGSTFVNTFSVAFSEGDLLLDGFRFLRIG